jgi:molybdopterin-containing oxidoreductase family iron-sulfur binding subunit
MNPRKNLDQRMADLWARLETATGKRYWRSLEELADTEAFQELMSQEFPELAGEGPGGLSRRQFLTLMGASLALAGVNGCSVRPAPSVDIVPYVRSPEELVPGRPLFYATAMTLGGTGVGLLVESHQGRPTKIEGNPQHPASLGATDRFHKASVLTLYDPERSQTVTHLGETATWDGAMTALRAALARHRARRGAGLRLLSETVVSPTLSWQIDEFLKEFPEAKWHQYEPLAADSAFLAAVQVFGEPVNTWYDFTKADVVLSLDSDFLDCGPGNLRYAHDFMNRRRVRNDAGSAGQARMNRLYVIEPGLSCTGAKADHRLAVPGSLVETLARAIASQLENGSHDGAPADQQAWVRAVTDELKRHAGRCVVLAGNRQPPVVHLLAHTMNQRLGNEGVTVIHTQPVAARPVHYGQSLRELVEEMEQGHIEMLLILGGNPVFTAPADYRFRERMQKVPLRAHVSLYQDETSPQCQWHLPEAHYLEAWSDTRAFDGTASIAQPLIEPLYQGRSVHEVLSGLKSKTPTPARDLVRTY